MQGAEKLAAKAEINTIGTDIPEQLRTPKPNKASRPNQTADRNKNHPAAKNR